MLHGGVVCSPSASPQVCPSSSSSFGLDPGCTLRTQSVYKLPLLSLLCTIYFTHLELTASHLIPSIVIRSAMKTKIMFLYTVQVLINVKHWQIPWLKCSFPNVSPYRCWDINEDSPFWWIIKGPIVVSIAVNAPIVKMMHPPDYRVCFLFRADLWKIFGKIKSFMYLRGENWLCVSRNQFQIVCLYCCNPGI